MKHIRAVAFIVAIVFVAPLANAQIPTNPNKTDAQGKRQGKWTIFLDKNWNPVVEKDSAAYFRLIEYKDDKPAGLVNDYYKSGKLQFTAAMVQDRPKEILTGKVTWFNEEGIKEKETLFDNGKPVDRTTVYYYTDGTEISDSVSVLTEKATALLEAQKYPEAIALFEKAKTRAASEFGKVSNPYIQILFTLGTHYNGLGDYINAEPYYKGITEIMLEGVGKEHPGYAISLNNLAELYKYMGRYEDAEPLYLQALQIQKSQLGENHPDYATSLNNIASLYEYMGRYEKAEPLYIQSLQIRKTELGEDHPVYAISLNNLAGLYKSMGRYEDAEPLYLQALQIQKSQLGETHPDYATSLHNLAGLYRSMGRYEKAEPLYLQDLQICKKQLGENHPEYATSISSLAGLYRSMGRYEKAEPLYLQALQIFKTQLGENHSYYASALNNLAGLYESMGRYEKAEPLYLQASQIYKTQLGENHPYYATSLGNLAGLYISMGRYEKAEPLYLQDIQISKKQLGENHPDYATSVHNLAVLYYDMGRYEKAEPLYLQALQIRKIQLGENHPDYATSLNALARLYTSTGRYEKAEPLYLQTLQIRKIQLGENHPDYATSLSNIADLYMNMGRYENAESLYIQALQIIKTQLGETHPDYARSLNNLSILYYSMGLMDKAETLYLESIAKKNNQIARHFPSMSESEKKDYYMSNQIYFTNFELFCVERSSQHPAILGEWYNLKLTTKGLLFQASNKIRNRILGSQDRDLIQFYNDWQAKKDFLAKVYQMPISEKQKRGIDEKKLEEEANTLEKSLSLKSELFATFADTKQYQWQDVHQKLKRGEAAIEMARTEKRINGAYVPVYVALIVTSQTQTHPDIVTLENGEEMERYGKYYINHIKKELSDTATYNQYWKPIANKLKGITKVYFSADGIYNQINLNTLYNPATKKYLMDEMDIQVVTSTKYLVTKSNAAIGKINNATLFGFPNYNNVKPGKADSTRAFSVNPVTAKATEIKKDSSAQRFFNGENINELPGTKVEVQTITSRLKKKNVPMQEFLYDKATETEIKKLSNPQVLHIATHGFFLTDLPKPKENERGFAGMEAKKVEENPLLRSGLLFAGAKDAFDETKRNESGEDGILTAYEAMSLDLDQTDLVVMSACETGLGVTANGEGVYGLQRAFQVAGAKSVLMSLWTVSDEATHQLMTLFYENWLAGKTPREAFREAQLSLRTKYTKPYYWGAFVLVGD